MIKLTLKEAKTGERILPANYSENYVSLLPGETRTVVISFSGDSAKPSVGMRGWNQKAEDINVNGAN
jgi:mannosylglycoprotein endo-beta-mannosidase